MLQTERIEQLEKQLEDTQQAADLYLENANQESQRILEAAREESKTAAQEIVRAAQTEKPKKKYGRNMENKETLIDYAQELPEKEVLQKEIKRERYSKRLWKPELFSMGDITDRIVGSVGAKGIVYFSDAV